MSPDSSATAKKQLLRFIVVGCSAVITDFITYTALLHIFTHAPAKTIAFITGSTFAYTLNKYWTFEKPGGSHTELARFITLYLCTLITNVAVNAAVLLIIPTAVMFAFLCATGTSTILNYIGQKWWVFK